MFFSLSQAFNSPHGKHSEQHGNLLVENQATSREPGYNHTSDTSIVDGPIKSTVESVDPHLQNVYYGLMALIGIIGFLIIERALTIISDLCHNSKRKTSKVSVGRAA